jgi:hypothetical protein
LLLGNLLAIVKKMVAWVFWIWKITMLPYFWSSFTNSIIIWTYLGCSWLRVKCIPVVNHLTKESMLYPFGGETSCL